jgi:hypothetical protein
MRDRREILDRVVRQLLHQRRVGRMRRVRRHEQRIAVGRGLRHDFRRDRAVRPRTIVDDHVLIQRIAQLLCRDARDRIGTASRRKWHDQADRPAWIGIIGARRQRNRGSGQRQDGGGQRAPHAEIRHVVSSVFLSAARRHASMRTVFTGRITRSGDSRTAGHRRRAA